MNETTLILAAALLPLSLGVFLSYRVFRIPDITTDGSFSLGGALYIWGVTIGLNSGVALLLSLTGGAISGAITGTLFQRLKIPALLAGILVMGALFSVNLLITGKANLTLPEPSPLHEMIGHDSNKNLLIGFISLGVFIMMILLLRSDFGLGLRAAGSNREAAAAQGIKINTMQNAGLALANGLTGVSGALMVLSQGFWDINMGTGIIIAGMAAVMIAEALSGRKGFFLHAFLLLPSTLLYRWIIAQVLSLGLEPVYVKLITSVMVISILALIHFKNKAPHA
jgi:putative ABC transport system permease protein